jgi:hypothetical protein
MLLSEEELPVQVAHLNHVWVSYNDFSLFSSAEAYHGIVLEKFATDGTSPDHEHLAVLDAFQQVQPNASFKGIVAPSFIIIKTAGQFSLALFIKGCNFLEGVEFSAVEVEHLVYGHKLLSDRFDDLLGHDSTKQSSDRREGRPVSESKDIGEILQLCQLLVIQFHILRQHLLSLFDYSIASFERVSLV